MNEERSGEELPNVPPLSPGERRGEFDRMRGEVQHPGSRIIGLRPDAPPPPIGIAPPDPRNVVSMFDTRPIGAYDFANTQVVTMGNGEAIKVQTVNFDVPDGYTAVLRRVRVEFTPPGAMLAAQPAAGAVASKFLTMSLLRSGGVIPNNSVRLFGNLDQYEWPTHQVFGFWEAIGLLLDPGTGFVIPLSPLNALFVGVTFMGTLIPTKSRPPETEIASDPVVTRDYDTLKNEVPETGAAGR